MTTIIFHESKCLIEYKLHGTAGMETYLRQKNELLSRVCKIFAHVLATYEGESDDKESLRLGLCQLKNKISIISSKLASTYIPSKNFSFLERKKMNFGIIIDCLKLISSRKNSMDESDYLHVTNYLSERGHRIQLIIDQHAALKETLKEQSFKPIDPTNPHPLPETNPTPAKPTKNKETLEEKLLIALDPSSLPIIQASSRLNVNATPFVPGKKMRF